MAKPRYDPGLDRQRLSQLLDELSDIVGAFCEHDPILRGKFEIVRRRCGKTPCRCTRGEPHVSRCLVDSSSGKRRFYQATPELRRHLRKPVRDYRRLRAFRIRLGKLNREFLGACDRLREARMREGAGLVPRLTE
jgi:hypothetical protein